MAFAHYSSLCKKQNALCVPSSNQKINLYYEEIVPFVFIDEYMMKNPGCFPGDVHIVGTDISTRVVKAATAAEYDRLSMARGLTPPFHTSFRTDRS